jgi:predicted HTH domain antitoxin
VTELTEVLLAIAARGGGNTESGAGGTMKQYTMVGARLPKELVRNLEAIEQAEQADRSTTVRKLPASAIDRWKLDYYAHQYGKGKISLARSAGDAGVSVWEMQSFVREQKIPAQYDREDFAHDLRTIYERGLVRRKLPVRPGSSSSQI